MPPKKSLPLSDVIGVREDERFDEARLTAYLRGKLEGSEAALRVEQFGGGHANLTYLLRFGDGDAAVEYVLRRPPLGPVAPGAHDMKREYRALSKLWQAFAVAPRAFLYCEDEAILGADFFVMQRRGGVVVRREVPEVFGAGNDPEANRKLSEVLVDTLVELHAVDANAIGLGEIGRPQGFLERQVRGWTARMEAAKTRDLPVAEELASWLLDNLPASPEPTLLHNDWKLDNIAVDPADPGRCVAVYDWDMCTLGDPYCDLGTLLCSWIDRAESAVGPGSMPSQSEGFMTRAEAIARYAERSGRDVSVVPYYHVFGTFKMAVVLLQIFVRYHRGQTHDERFKAMDLAADALFLQGARRRP
ncbi:MAG: phosphotransferase family protein [Myxococcota bacterium]|jgi:aminoglycoside phosphotransferase (APT) family kinase protein